MMKVSGIIDWEVSGFYLDYLESHQILRLLGRNVENDWWQYVPRCVDPTRAHRERWLVRTIWDLYTGISAVKVDEYQRDTVEAEEWEREKMR